MDDNYALDALIASLGNKDDSAASYLNPDLVAQEQALKRRQAVLDARAKAAAEGTGAFAPPQAPAQGEGWTSAVTGAKMLGRQPKASGALVAYGLGQMLGPVAMDAMQRDLDRDRSGFNRVLSADAVRRLAGMPMDMPEQGPPDPVTGQLPTRTPTLQQKLQWAADARQNPTLAPVVDKYIEDQLLHAPDRATKSAFELRKQQAQEAHWNRQDSKPPSPNYIPIVNDSGQYTGFFDSRAGVYYNAQGLPVSRPPAGTPRPEAAQDQPFAAGGPASAPTSPNTVPGVEGKSSATNQKAAADAAQSVTNAREALTLLEGMKPLFSTATTTAAKKVYDKVTGMWSDEPIARDDKLDDLALQASNLAKYADRKMFGPQFTDADVKAIKESVGDLSRPISVTKRETIYERLREIFQRQAAGASPDDLRGTIEALVRARGEPTGSFKGDPSAAIEGIRDPVEREMARRAFANQRASGGAPASTAQPAARSVVRRGTLNGRPVVQYSDGSVDYAD